MRPSNGVWQEPLLQDVIMLKRRSFLALAAAPLLLAQNEDGARKKLLELFEAWGPKDPATLKGRRLLSSVLFS